MASSLSDSVLIAPVKRPIDAVVPVPGSKSITNRALLIAGLADGESLLRGMLFSDDTRYMAEALEALGLTVETDTTAETARIIGGGGAFPKSKADLYVGNSGTTMRFLTAALAVANGTYRVDGNTRMRERPIGPLLSALNQLGSSARSESNNNCPPVIIEAAGLPGGTCSMDGGQSSQYFSALLMAAPYAESDVTMTVEGDLVSKPYMEITAAVMADFGVTAQLDRDVMVDIHGQIRSALRRSRLPDRARCLERVVLLRRRRRHWRPGDRKWSRHSVNPGRSPVRSRARADGRDGRNVG